MDEARSEPLAGGPLQGGRGTITRCPACGQAVVQPPASRCAWCGFVFEDDRITGSDVTPYAKAYARGLPGWRRMGEWIWFCGQGRLKHLALMRASAASRRFAAINLALLALGVALLEATRSGWRWVRTTSASEPPGGTGPVGSGWWHVAGTPEVLSANNVSQSHVELWWNPIQTITAVVVTLIVGFAVAWLVMILVRAGVTRSHQAPYRGEQRMTAALHYSTAWCLPLFAAAVVVGLRPIAFIGGIRRWVWCPPESGFLLSAAVVAGFGVIMWWFWLIRLGATAPARTRRAVVTFAAIGVPLIATAVTAGWWFGIGRVYQPLLVLMNMKV